MPEQHRNGSSSKQANMGSLQRRRRQEQQQQERQHQRQQPCQLRPTMLNTE
jgi:hypothetical protein